MTPVREFEGSEVLTFDLSKKEIFNGSDTIGQYRCLLPDSGDSSVMSLQVTS